jgi:acetyl-CoA carboxylase carboxyl transferase subunit alpha
MEFVGSGSAATAASLRSASNGIVMQCAGRFNGRAATTPSSGAPQRTRSVKIVAKIKKGKMGPEEEYPWPDKFPPGEITDGALKYLNRFKPMPNPTKPVTLPFERPIADLENKIDEVRELANKTGLDFTEQIAELEERYDQVRKELYGALTPMQRLSVARHPNRPTFLDHVLNITDSWIELHGDRGGFDDPAMVCGVGSIDGMSFVFIGQQKGRNTKENIHRNFAMPMPNGYRKALRFMRHAEKFGFPVLTFIDTPGAYAGVKAEELGQGEAIAFNLREMFGIKVPIIATVIGEGGSGGALAIGCGNKMLMLENAVYYVASPEACAAILWKTAAAAPKAAEALLITTHELQKWGVVDDIIQVWPVSFLFYSWFTVDPRLFSVVLASF